MCNKLNIGVGMAGSYKGCKKTTKDRIMHNCLNALYLFFGLFFGGEEGESDAL